MKQQMLCPVCGHRMNAQAARQIVAEIQAGKTVRCIMEVLADHFGMWMSRERIAALVYADRADGGPESGLNIISVHVSLILPRLKQRGLTIERCSGVGLRMVWLQ